MGPAGPGMALGSYLDKGQKLWRMKQSDRICLMVTRSLMLRIEEEVRGGTW